MIDISKLAKEMIKNIENTDASMIVESIPLNLNQAKKLRDDYLSDYSVIGIDNEDPKYPLLFGRYVVCVRGNKNA